MNYTKVFYWLTVADNAKLLFGWVGVLFTIVGVIALVGRILVEDHKINFKTAGNRKWVMWGLSIGLVFLSLWVFTPTKKDALLIVGGGQAMNFLASDSSAKQIPEELSNFVLIELRNMAKTVEVDLGVKSQKERLVEEAKNLSTEQLLKRLKTDEGFKEIILSKK